MMQVLPDDCPFHICIENEDGSITFTNQVVTVRELANWRKGKMKKKHLEERIHELVHERDLANMRHDVLYDEATSLQRRNDRLERDRRNLMDVAEAAQGVIQAMERYIKALCCNGGL